MPPTVKTAEDVSANDGQRVRLIGVYRKRMVQKKQGGPQEWMGHVEIVVEGSPRAYNPTAWEGAEAAVQLDYLAKRPEAEVAKLEGKKVAVDGKLLLDPSKLEPAGERARTRPTPAIVEIGPVELAK